MTSEIGRRRREACEIKRERREASEIERGKGERGREVNCICI